MVRVFTLVFLSFFLTNNSFAQKKIKLTGLVTDYNNQPIEGALIFIDSVKTNKKTDTPLNICTFVEVANLKVSIGS